MVFDTTRTESYVLGATLAPFFGIAFARHRRGDEGFLAQAYSAWLDGTSSAEEVAMQTRLKLEVKISFI